MDLINRISEHLRLQEVDMWQKVHHDPFTKFYDQDGASEVTIPVGHIVKWDPSMPRPEMDKKDKGVPIK